MNGQDSGLPVRYRDSIRWNAAQLHPSDGELLTAWPTTLCMNISGIGKVLFCHATPQNPCLHGDVLSEAGHEVQIFLLGEAVSLMRKSVANAVVPVGWPPLAEVLAKLVAKKIPIYACGACSRARGVTETDLAEFGAKFGNPKTFVSLIERAEKVITE